MFRELSAPLTSNKCLSQPVVGECLGMTDFSSDPLLELLGVLCHGAVEARESIKLRIKKKNRLFPSLISKMNISISVLPLGRMAGEGQFEFQQ